MNKSTILKGNIVTETAVLADHCICIEQEKIQAIAKTPPDDNQPFRPGKNRFILPGFRDPHIHDIHGQLQAPFLTIKEIAERLQKVMRALAQSGVTGVYMATFGAPLEHLETYCRGARLWMENEENGLAGAKLLGVNIEGTFLNEECRGAQPAEFCLIPTRDDCISALDRLHATGAVKLVNIAPDYGQPSLRTIQHAQQSGILVGAGHTKCSADILREAFEHYGLQYMVHFTNGPTGQSFKPFGGGGAFEGALGIPIVKELVLDRYHVDERYVLDIIRRTEELWGNDKMIVVTDSSFPIPGEIPDNEFLIGTTVAQKDASGRFCRSVAYSQPDGTTIPAPDNTLCGSLLSMDKAFGNLATLFTSDIRGHWFEHPALPLDQAVVKAARLCSTNQAILDGHSTHTGSIAVGKDADLVIGSLESQEGRYAFHVETVWVHGEPVI
ncbi:MAG: hypothetical protein C4527_17430 [Candidatus Omnitrophota bacterium]|nr:MAG: hypothetical protein C4527_17430 [Candidatus Omnitrophota bacterium]